MKRITTTLILAILLLQSCVVYQQSPVTIDGAVDKGNVKVETLKGKELKYEEIKSKNNSYYGIRGEKEVLVDSLLISNVYLKDIKKSKEKTLLNIGSVVLGIALYIIFLVVISP